MTDMVPASLMLLGSWSFFALYSRFPDQFLSPSVLIPLLSMTIQCNGSGWNTHVYLYVQPHKNGAYSSFWQYPFVHAFLYCCQIMVSSELIPGKELAILQRKLSWLHMVSGKSHGIWRFVRLGVKPKAAVPWKIDKNSSRKFIRIPTIQASKWITLLPILVNFVE